MLVTAFGAKMGAIDGDMLGELDITGAFVGDVDGAEVAIGVMVCVDVGSVKVSVVVAVSSAVGSV